MEKLTAKQVEQAKPKALQAGRWRWAALTGELQGRQILEI